MAKSTMILYSVENIWLYPTESLCSFCQKCICDPPYENTSYRSWQFGWNRVSNGFPKGLKLPKPSFQRVSKGFLKGFQRVSKGFQMTETGFLKGFKILKPGFKTFLKGFLMSFQTVSKRFETPWNQVSKGFPRAFSKALATGFKNYQRVFYCF